MNLLNLPPELVERIFQDVACSREFKRVMRLRLVSRMFKRWIDDTIFRLRLINRIPGPPDWLMSPGGKILYPEWYAYVYQYLAYQAWLEKDPKSLFGRIRRAAMTISELAGDAEQPAVMARLQALCGLACGLGGADISPSNSYPLLRTDRPKLIKFFTQRWVDGWTPEELENDLVVAAAHLGFRPVIDQAIFEGHLLCPWGSGTEVFSRVFGRVFQSALVKGDVSMLRLLLTSSTEYEPDGPLHRNIRSLIMKGAALFGHREAYDFALGGDLRGNIEYIMQEMRYPDQYERTRFMISGRSSRPGVEQLSLKIKHGHTEMVKYLLEQGISPNHEEGKAEGPFCQPYKPLVNAVGKGSLEIVKLLLDHGADPNWFHETNTPLMVAARLGWYHIAETLLAAGADVYVGCPPPIVLAVLKEDMDMFRLLRRRGAKLDTPESGGWAMALAQLYGLESMVGVLEQEGVKADVILHRCARFEELYADDYLYAWPDEEESWYS
ncbi:MBOAT family protein [Apiospora arundinis]